MLPCTCGVWHCKASCSVHSMGRIGVGGGAAPVLWDVLLLAGREGEEKDVEDVKFPLPINPSLSLPLCVFWIINGPFTIRMWGWGK